MKVFNKILSVLLALVLCGSMAAPAFAASFEDLQNAISDNFSGNPDYGIPAGTPIGNGSYGYGSTIENTAQYEIEAWDGQDGTRNVKVNTDITASVGESSITVSDGKKVDLDLGNSTITGNGNDSVFYVAGGDGDSDPTTTPNPGELNITGGTIKGGGGTTAQENPGSEPEGSSADNTGDEPTQPTSNPTQGGGIYVGENATLTLDGTKVTGNTADEGAGIYAAPGATVEIKGGAEVSGNTEDDVYLDYGDTGYPNPNGKLGGASITLPNGVTVNDGSKDYTGGKVDSTEGKKPIRLTWGAQHSNSGGSNGGSVNTPPTVEVEDPDTPLGQGPTTCGEFIYKMWVLDGEPVPVDSRAVDGEGKYAPAFTWALSAGIVSVDSFDAEALLTVALAKEYLNHFAAYADMAMPELTTLTGKDGDLVTNSDDVLDEFFGKKDGE